MKDFSLHSGMATLLFKDRALTSDPISVRESRARELSALLAGEPTFQPVYKQVRAQLEREFPKGTVYAEVFTDPDDGTQSILFRIADPPKTMGQVLDQHSEAQESGRVDDPDPSLVMIVAY
jgi:hypothetical protein